MWLNEQKTISRYCPFKAKHTLFSECGLKISYPHSFSDVRALNIAESHRSKFGVQVARIKIAGGNTVPGFVYINSTASAKKEKYAPLRFRKIKTISADVHHQGLSNYTTFRAI